MGTATVTPFPRRRPGVGGAGHGPGSDSPSNLPAPLTSFVGRTRELGALLAAHRLVTLVGAPGVGKTRLALRAAGEALGRFPDGAWLVELAPLADPALVQQAIATALGVPRRPAVRCARRCWTPSSPRDCCWC